ncbi:helix-turn-helix domain-containing protein [Brevibacterium sp. 5221]|uniref:Helix-turn-helix domain-containing protein n=2 Tax=Brevibacteriaceae TaxID=85019 RepID=A0A6N9H7G8_9MICO|nr:helix-turn-helix domain-containing protein [Brevibacterium rongguiense]
MTAKRMTKPTTKTITIPPPRGGRTMTLVRTEIGDTLRATRRQQNRTLRDVSTGASVSLGYLSEIERGQKEASSELLASICEALDMPVSALLREVSDRMALSEGVQIPDTVPAELSERVLADEAMAGR